MTISVDDEIERRLRRVAETMYGKRKGYLGKAIAEAVREWSEKKEKDDVIMKSLELLERGVKMKKWKFNRDELHER